MISDVSIASDFDRLQSLKQEANSHFSKSEYKSALELYYRILNELFSVKNSEFNLEEFEKNLNRFKNELSTRNLTHFLSIICCNIGICHNLIKNNHDAIRFFKITLVLDDQNYKANYHLSHLHISNGDYNNALVYLQSCERIVNNNPKLWINKHQPHLDLYEQIRSTLKKTDISRSNVDDPDHLASEICSGSNFNLNIQRLQLVSSRRLLNSDALKQLSKFCIKRLEDDHIDEDLSSVWFCIYKIIYECDDEYKFKVYSQLTSTFETEGSSLVSYVKSVVKLNTQKPDPIYQSVLTNIVMCCSVVRGLDSFETLVFLLEKEEPDLELVISSILLYFSKNIESGTTYQDPRFNSLLVRLMEKLFSLCDGTFPNQSGLSACIISVFKMKFYPFEVSLDSFGNMINRALEVYMVSDHNSKDGFNINFEINWYLVINCLFLTNRTLFKSHMIINSLVHQVVRVFFNEMSNEKRRLAFELMINCADVVEFRQEMLDYVQEDESFLGLLKSPELVKFVNKLSNGFVSNRRLKYELDKKSLDHFHFFIQSTILLLSKLSLHSTQVKDEVLGVFDIFKLISSMVLYNLENNINLELVLQSMSFASLHEEFKRSDLSFLPVLLNSVSPTDSFNFYILQTITNLLRGNKDRTSFLEDLDLTRYDKDQLKQLKMIEEKLPQEAKANVNGVYFEGNDESANIARVTLFSLSDSSVPLYLCKTFNKLESETLTSLIVESLHYLTLNVNHRRYLQSLGVLRIFISVANSPKYQGKSNPFRTMNRYKLIVQSMTHLIISNNPSNLTFNDAHDSIQPLMNLLEDENELFQYESALALINLLSINDDIRKRVYSLKGWEKFSSLLFSENEMLKTAALEGWCNLCAGDDVVHGYFYMQIKSQIDGSPPDKVYEVNVHDINIMLMFISPGIRPQSLSAASGALALLVRDARIAQYIPFVSRFENVLKTLEQSEDPAITHRLLTIISCVVQSEMKNLTKVNQHHVQSVTAKIRECVKRNLNKCVNQTLLDLYNEICL